MPKTAYSMSITKPDVGQYRPRCASVQAKGVLDVTESEEYSSVRAPEKSNVSLVDPYPAELALHDGFVAADLERLLMDADASIDLELMSREWQRFSRFMLSFPATSQTPVQYELFGWFLEMSQYFPNMDDICTEFTNMLQRYRSSKRRQSRARLRTARSSHTPHLNYWDVQSPRSVEWRGSTSTDTDSPFRSRREKGCCDDGCSYPDYYAAEDVEEHSKTVYRRDLDPDWGHWGDMLDDENLNLKGTGDREGSPFLTSLRRREMTSNWRRDRAGGGHWSERERCGEMDLREQGGNRLFVRYSSTARRHRLSDGDNPYPANSNVWPPIVLSRQTCGKRRQRRSIVEFSMNDDSEARVSEQCRRGDDEGRVHIHRVKSSPRLYDVYEDAVSTASPTTMTGLQKAEMERLCDRIPHPPGHTIHYSVLGA